MSISHPDSRWRGLLTALAAAAALLGAGPAVTAGSSQERLIVEARNGMSGGGPSGVLTLNMPVVQQGSTLLRATKATATNYEDGFKNSTMNFDGNVHLEFDGATLDAHAATAVFVNERLVSIDVRAARGQQPAKPVHVEFNDATLDVSTVAVAFAAGRISTIKAQGAPAQFSHVLKKTGKRVSGRSNRIDYDAGTRMIGLSDDTWFTKDGLDLTAASVNYNLDTGEFNTSAAIGTAPFRERERVPAPATPDRTSAK